MLLVFQSLTGRLQTPQISPKFPPNPRFNPSQVGYKRLSLPYTPQMSASFNPSQVGYKLWALVVLIVICIRFNPSQVGYKPTRLLRVGPENEFKTVPIVKVRALPVGGFIIPHRCR